MSAPQQPRLAVLISGRGSNLQAFIDACANGELPAQISLVISNNPDATGLQRAERAGIAAKCINHRNFATREAFDAALVHELRAHAVELVILAGFMRILTPVLIEPYLGRLLNIHPSLLPKYTGLNTHQRAIDAGDEFAGVTVHFVTPELDGGPSILQAKVAIESEETVESLAQKVLQKEHVIYPLAAQWFLEGKLKLQDNHVLLEEKVLPTTGLLHQE